MATWYILKGKKEHGPFTAEQLKKLAGSGKLLPQDQIRKHDKQKIVQAANVKGLFQTVVTECQGNPEGIGESATVSKDTKKRCGWLSFIGISLVCLVVPVSALLLWHPSSGHILDAISDLRDSGNGTDSASASSSNVKLNAEYVQTTDGVTSDTVELTTPTLNITPNHGYDDLFITNDAKYLLVGYREIWHLPTSKKLQLPAVVDTWKWLRAAVSPDGSFLAATVVTVNKNDRPIGTQLQVYKLDEGSAPTRIASHALIVPSVLPNNIESPVIDRFMNWTKMIWSKDSSTICVASRFGVNVVTDWQKQPSIQIIAHPEILDYSDSPLNFSGFVMSRQDDFTIASISCSHDGHQIAVCYKRGGIEVHSTTTKKRKFLPFPECITTWSFEKLEFAPSGGIAVAAIQQESGFVKQQEKRAFHTSRRWHFVWNTTDWSLVRSFGPVKQDSPNDDSSPRLIGLSSEPTRILFFSVLEGTDLNAVDVESGEIVFNLKLDHSLRHYWEGTMSPNDRFLMIRRATGSYRVLNASTFKDVMVIKDPDREEGSYDVALSGDGGFLAIGHKSGPIRIWDSSTGRRITPTQLAQIDSESTKNTTEKRKAEEYAPPLDAVTISRLRKGLAKSIVRRIVGGKPQHERINRLENYPDKSVVPFQHVQEYLVKGDANARIILLYEVGSDTNPILESIHRIEK